MHRVILNFSVVRDANLLDIFIPEMALQQSRSKEIQGARSMLDSQYDVEVLTEDAEKAAIDAAVNVVLNAKKIKRELHMQ